VTVHAELIHDEVVANSVTRQQSPWSTLYRTAAVCSIAVVTSVPIALIAFVVWPPPATASDWFAFIQKNKLAAVINLDLMLLLDEVLFIPVILALYVRLRRVSPPLVLLGTVGSLVGATLLIVSREATFSMLTLSDQYAAAASEAEQMMVLAAGQLLLATFNGTAFSVGYALLGVSGLLVTSAMLRSQYFRKPTAYTGMCTYALATLPPTVGTLGVVLSLVSLAPLVSFQVLLARSFFQFAADTLNRQKEVL
jgi:Domain of unknown function (DUF4386)